MSHSQWLRLDGHGLYELLAPALLPSASFASSLVGLDYGAFVLARAEPQGFE